MPRSKAWKSLEKEAAKALKGQRVSRGDDFGKSDIDVYLIDLPFVKIDAKYRASHAHHTLLKEIEEKYCKHPADVPVLVTKHHNQRGSNVTVPMYFFAELIKAFREINVDKDLGPVAKAKVAYAKEVQASVEPFQDGCTGCGRPEDECDCCIYNCTCNCCREGQGYEYCVNHLDYDHDQGDERSICGCNQC